MIEPSGQQREVKSLGSASIDGTPLDYIVVMSAVVTVLAFIPFSITIGSGGIFPLSQGIFPLLGWVLGPVGGALASGMVIGKQRKYWWFFLSIFFVVAFYIYTSRAMNNQVSLSVIVKGSFINWSGILLFILPTRILFAKWINSENLRLVWLGLFFGSWTVAGVYHVSQAMITYTMFNWPEEVWILLIPIMPLENLVRSLVGAFIGVRVISGLRAIGIMKPEAAIY